MAWDMSFSSPPSSSTGRSPDWVFSESSSAHLTNDKSWFEGDLVEFPSQITNVKASIANIPVKGVGTVVLPVKQSIAGHHTGNFNSFDTGALRLENVLYVPDYPCNVIGAPIKAVTSVQFSSMTPRGAMVYGDGSIAAIFKPGRDFYQVMLRDNVGGGATSPVLGASVLDCNPEYGYLLGFEWPMVEQQRWKAHQASLICARPMPPQRRFASSCANEFRLSMMTGHGMDAGAMSGVIENPWPSMATNGGGAMDVDNQGSSLKSSRKRCAPDEDEDFGCSPRRAKRSRAMDEVEFGSPRPMRAVFSAWG